MFKAEKLKNYEQKRFRPGYASVKLNGIHGICDPDSKIIYSRTPKVFHGMQHIVDELSHLAYPMVGELFIPGVDFETCSGRIRDFHETPEAQFYIFNCIVPNAPFRQRLEYMCTIRDQYYLCHPNIKFVEYTWVNIAENFDHVNKHYLIGGAEGTCWISPDHVYQPGKRTWDWMKRVPFKSLEATVIAVLPGTKGKKYEDSLGAFLCKMDNGKEFRCGIFKGQTDEWRKNAYLNSGEWIGKRITVEFKAYTKYGRPAQPRYKAERWDLEA